MFLAQIPVNPDAFQTIFLALREFNTWVALVVAVLCLVRLYLVVLFWRKSFRDGRLLEELNLEKLIAWTALFAFNIGAGIGTYVHKANNSVTGVFIPLVTLGILLTIVALLVAKQNTSDVMLFQKIKRKLTR